MSRTTKNSKISTIQISIETKGKLDSIITEFEEILNCKASYDKILRILLYLREEGLINLV